MNSVQSISNQMKKEDCASPRPIQVRWNFFAVFSVFFYIKILKNQWINIFEKNFPWNRRFTFPKIVKLLKTHLCCEWSVEIFRQINYLVISLVSKNDIYFHEIFAKKELVKCSVVIFCKSFAKIFVKLVYERCNLIWRKMIDIWNTHIYSVKTI